MKTLLDLLENNNSIPMHMPGHKRNTAPAPYLKRLAADVDITEISGFDNLHAANGILMQSMQRAAEMRSADRAFYLVNGATGGILAAICALVTAGDKVICARNCHKSVYNALELSGAEPVFVLPDIDKKSGICMQLEAEQIEKKIIENPDARLVVVTSPTYEGVVSDVEGICRAAHNMGIPVFVDAAHGAHFGFGHGFPRDAMSCGADIAVESLHKTLPSLTQTAICYARKEFAEGIAERLAVFQSSSPSYILLASIDSCITLLSENADGLFSAWKENLDEFGKMCEGLENIKILKKSKCFFDLDPSKIVMLTQNGKGLFEELKKRHIECEMASCSYVVAMTGPGDTREMLSYLAVSLRELDKAAKPPRRMGFQVIGVPEKVMSVREAKRKATECVGLGECAGRVAAEYVWAYPPGIPLIAPGERISEDETEAFKGYIAAGIDLLRSSGGEKGKILVTK